MSQKAESEAKSISTKTETRATNDKRGDKPPMLELQFRGNQRQLFSNKVRSISNAQIVCKTRISKTALLSFKSSFSCDLNYNVVYKLSCCRCNSPYVRHLATRIEEHKKKDSPVGIRIRQCGEEATTAQLNWEVIDHLNNAMKLLTLEALHTTKLRPEINTRDEFRIMELTL